MPEEKVEFPWKTPQTDVRYPNMNQTRRCFQMFYDYNRCIRLFNKSYEPCNYFQHEYTTLCPNGWVAKWQEQIEKGTFPADLPEQK